MLNDSTTATTAMMAMSTVSVVYRRQIPPLVKGGERRQEEELCSFFVRLIDEIPLHRSSLSTVWTYDDLTEMCVCCVVDL